LINAVDYTIAARGGQANAAPDFVNMLAQYQMMGARAQQQQLSNFSMQKLDNKSCNNKTRCVAC